jgi:type IV secretion system protein VirD4
LTRNDQPTDLNTAEDRPGLPEGLAPAKPVKWAPAAAGAATVTPGGHLGLNTVVSVVDAMAKTMPGHWLGVGALGTLGAGILVLRFKDEVLGGSGSAEARNRRPEGFATRREIRRHLGAGQLRKQMARLRPSLAEQMRWYKLDRWRIDPQHAGFYLGRDKHHRRRVYTSCENVTGLLAPPRAGKSALLGGLIIPVPGAAFVTSTRGDLYTATHKLRRRVGPVEVMNAEIAGVASTVKWSPVAGCRDAVVAVRRAGYMISTGLGADDLAHGNFWHDNSFLTLRNMLMAADLEGLNLRDVARWVGDYKLDEPLTILRKHAGQVPHAAEYAENLNLIMSGAPETVTSIYLTLVRVLGFMSLPHVAELCCPGPGEKVLDVEYMIRQRGTMYMIGEEREQGGVGPLFATLAGEFYDIAREIAMASPGERIDPPISFILDEAAVICPLPLVRWTSDGGGRNMAVLFSVQNLAQLYKTWGQYGGTIIWGNANKLILGGNSIEEHLDAISALCGERDWWEPSFHTNAKGEQTRGLSSHRVPVMSPVAIRTLDPGTVLYIHKSAHPTILKFDAVWDRADVKALAKQEKRQAKLATRQQRQAAKAAARGELVNPPLVIPPMPTYQPYIPPQTAPADQPAASAGGWVDMDKRNTA